MSKEQEINGNLVKENIYLHKELEKKDKVIDKISEEVKENLAFEKRLKRENTEPDLYNQGRFYVSDNINNILKGE